MSLPRIFVQIACYRDPECQWTVKDLFDQAKYPERISVGICWQFDAEHDQDCFIEPSSYPDQTRVIEVPAQESQGVCWARHLVQTLYQDEDYILMIDSHMRFIENWDEAVISELDKCVSEKSFLSSYPPGYKLPNELSENPRPTILRAKAFDPAGDIRFDGEALPIDPPAPLRGAFLAGGFIFARGEFIKEIPYDPYLYFNHEEICLAVRAFTHGWDAYSASQTFVYHLYQTGGANRRLHWEDNKDWSRMSSRSRARYNHLLCRQISDDPEVILELDKYGLGKERSLEEFEAFTGIDFLNKSVSEKGLRAEFIENLDLYRYPKEQDKESPE